MAESGSDISVLLARSREKHLQGDLQSAREGYLEVLSVVPEQPLALNGLGSVDAQLGNLEDAERLIRRAISAAPREAAFYTNLANVLQEQQRYADAVRAYRLALRIDPEQTEVLNNIGALLLRTGQAEEAETCFRKVLESRPESPEVLNNLGRALNNQGRHEEAAAAFEDAIRMDPAFAAAYNNLGHVYRATGKHTHAAASFQEAIRLDPAMADAYRNLGTVYLAQNMPEQAIECLREAVRRAPEVPGVYADLGVALHGIGRLGEAVNAYREAIRLAPRDAHHFLNLGLVLYERRNLKAAESALRQALELRPDLAGAAAELAGILDEQGRLTELEAVTAKGLAIAPEHPRLNLEAARLERRRGDYGKALERLGRFDLKAMKPRLAQQFRYELGRLNDRAGETGLAWLHFSEANRLAAESWRTYELDPQRLERRMQALLAYYSEVPQLLTENPAAEEEPAPVFLVGFPASGSEFVAEVLRRHDSLQVLDEAPTLSAVEERLAAMPEGYPAALARLEAAEVASLRALYLDVAGALVRREAGSILVDHHPMRALHAGLVWRLFPTARFVHVRRHPGDLCLANFMQNYAINDTNAHFLDIATTARAMSLAWRVWQACARIAPVPVHSVSFEDLAADPGRSMAGVMKFLGLEMHPEQTALIDAVKRGDKVTRSSFRHLADPMDAHATGRWKAYRRELTRVFDELLPLADDQGYRFA